MDVQEMCQNCLAEYENQGNIRFFSQTNSCPDCAIQMNFLDEDGVSLGLKQGEMIKNVVQKLREGKIGAIKGIGGFLLICDAGNSKVIKELPGEEETPQKTIWH